MKILLENFHLYLLAFFLPMIFSVLLTPLLRRAAVKFSFFDIPSHLKKHGEPIPHVGGMAVMIACFMTLILMRFYTSFPTGTLRDLRILLFGGFVMFVLGLVDDIHKPEGLSVASKFAIQILTAVLVVFYGVKIKFIQPEYISSLISVLWIVGISNAINIIDIMDGLSGSQVAAASLGFLIIAMPSESIYVNFAAAALLGATVGFLPYNFSRKRKTFMGDSGSLFCGFVLAFLAMGTKYTELNPLGVYAPLLILSVPIFDTLFVSAARMAKGMSPFRGSGDHLALRLKTKGLGEGKIVALFAAFSVLMSAFAYLLTQTSPLYGIVICAVSAAAFATLSVFFSRLSSKKE